jgi:xanthine/uracil permease
MGIGRVHRRPLLYKARPWHAPHSGLPQGLGFLSFISIVIVEIFGSPFMRNCSVVMGLIIGASSLLREIANLAFERR